MNRELPDCHANYRVTQLEMDRLGTLPSAFVPVILHQADDWERKDLQHQLFEIMLDGRLHLAPIPPTPQCVLDIATGSGIWAIEFGKVSVQTVSVVQQVPADSPNNTNSRTISFSICDCK